MNQGMLAKLFRNSVLILLILVCAYLFLHSSFFAIDKIYVTGLNTVSQDEIIDLSLLTVGMNIFTINEKICCRAIEIHPLIKSSNIVRHLPREIEIQVQERKIWALVPYQGSLLCIDDEGVCMDKLNHLAATDYPVVSMDIVPEYINLGQIVDEVGIALAWEIWNLLEADQQKEISEFHYRNEKQEVLIYTNRGTEIRWGSAERMEEKAAYFKQMLQMEDTMQDEGKDALKYVDLRFTGQPVVKTILHSDG